MVRIGVSVFCSFGVSIFICSPPNEMRYVCLSSVFVFRCILPSRAILVFLVSWGWSLSCMVTWSFSFMVISSLGSSIVIFSCSFSDVRWYFNSLFESVGSIFVTDNSDFISAILFLHLFGGVFVF